MRTNLPVTDNEYHLSEDTLIVSKTDVKGKLTYFKLPGGGNSPVPVIANTTQAPERTGLLKRVALVVSLALALLLAKAA